jgi:3-oxoacyl-[acyl-carrier-protein] synthase II
MKTQRVVVTGMAGLCPLGSNWAEVSQTLRSQQSRISRQAEWDSIEGLQTRLGAGIEGFSRPAHFTRKRTRTMGRVSLLAAQATEWALQDAGLPADGDLSEWDCGIAYGSTSGSPPSIKDYAEKITVNKSLRGVTASEYVKFMSHTTTANLSQFFGIKGRLIPSCSACTSGSQAIGFAYEAVKFGRHQIMVAGGAEELHILAATVFDIMYATSTRNDEPQRSPRPFDRDRDGLVVGEGAGTLILESLEHAKARNATIYAEIVGFATNCDGEHIVSPSEKGMRAVMQGALDVAGLDANEIGYISAHGTATEVGDIAESQATRAVFQRDVAISSLKSYMGHTLGACGALESWIAIEGMREGWFPPTLNLEHPDPACAELNYLREVTNLDTSVVMNNNFAFGGVNTSLIFAKYADA